MRFYIPSELAKMAHVSRQRVHEWIKTGKIPVTQLDNRQYIIAEVDIPAFIREKAKKGGDLSEK